MKKTRSSRQASNGSKQISFLPELDYNPMWPKRNTLTHRALCLMLRGREITPIDFENETSSQRLPAYIEILHNKLGWPVEREDVAIRLKNKPRTRLFRKYYFNKKFIESVKKISGGVAW